jgi:hypothetical protein
MVYDILITSVQLIHFACMQVIAANGVATIFEKLCTILGFVQLRDGI